MIKIITVQNFTFSPRNIIDIFSPKIQTPRQIRIATKVIPPKYLGWNASATLFLDWVKSPAARLAHCLLGLSWLSGCLFQIQFYNSNCLGFLRNIHNEYLRSPIACMIFTRNSHHLVHSTRNVQAKSKQNFVLKMILRLQN